MAHWSFPTLRSKGFTLLEVLVALVIVSLGIIAVFGQINQSVAGASYLRSKTLAHWIAIDQITEMRLKQTYPAVSERKDEIEMAGILWLYTIEVSDMPELPAGNLRRIDVRVAFEDTPEAILATATGFITSPGPNALTGAGASAVIGGWVPGDPNRTSGNLN